MIYLLDKKVELEPRSLARIPLLTENKHGIKRKPFLVRESTLNIGLYVFCVTIQIEPWNRGWLLTS